MLAQDSCITSTTRIIQKPKSRMLKKAKEKKKPNCMYGYEIYRQADI